MKVNTFLVLSLNAGKNGAASPALWWKYQQNKQSKNYVILSAKKFYNL